jgi:hypothetical protein
MLLRPSPTCMLFLKESECGHGVNIMTKQEIFVGENSFAASWLVNGKNEITNLPLKDSHYPFGVKPWSQLRRESVYLPAVESYAPLSSYIINQCDKAKCSADVDRFKVRLDELKSIGSIIKP